MSQSDQVELAAQKSNYQQFVASLRDIVGDTGVLEGEAVSSRYPGYFMERVESRLLVRPSTTEEVSQVLRLCNARQQPVVTQGGMSGWVRATQTRPGDLILSMERLHAIEEVDTVNRTVTVQSGVILQTLQEQLEPHDLIFPLDLGGRGSCQVGGNAATNAGGIRVIRYGMMRSLVLGLEAVMADGSVISSMNKMLKNNSGYDIKQLFMGSEGTLGVITRLVLRLYERPRSDNAALLALNDFASVAKFLRFIDSRLGGKLSAFEVLDNTFYRINTQPGRQRAPISGDYPYYVITESLGFDDSIDAAQFEQVLVDAAEAGLIADAVIAKSGAEREAIWQIRENLEHVVKEMQPFQAFDVSMPIGDMAPYMQTVAENFKKFWPEGQLCFLGHVGDGNLHIAAGCGSSEPGARRAVEECVYQPLQHIGGSISAEHGIGLEKKDFLSLSRGDNELRLMQLLKRSLDPNGILNPGKVIDLEE
ncbi:FAD-binding oxidoreductase [Spongiibacter taiwanensis]|uniref:FAD-binding oxidoreductase n=1 Tax=Spongiibacter taiwanensis TaxID=1748242 RepID=UPI002036575D|nr:FAD-binding oxidoreductase [Spongiibacter taiwanensis]USA42440.1 FAD-binding oxidoreductase [Spongiibacter taiwanensis]